MCEKPDAEQRARFDAMQAGVGEQPAQTTADEQANACSNAKPGLADLPIDRIEPAIPRSNLYFPSVVAEEYGAREVYRRVLKPIFDAMWNAAGYAERPAS
jgi:hypothetical protein